MTIVSISEKQWQSMIIDLARRFQYEFIYHTWSSRHSPAGFPDLVLLKNGVMIVIEVKREDGQPTPEQYFWLLEFTKVTPFVFLWKPSDFDEAVEVLEELREPGYVKLSKNQDIPENPYEFYCYGARVWHQEDETKGFKRCAEKMWNDNFRRVEEG